MGLFGKKNQAPAEEAPIKHGSMAGDAAPGVSAEAAGGDGAQQPEDAPKKGLFGGGKAKKGKPPKEKKPKKGKDDRQAAPKKKKSELVSVLDESVWESVNEDFKANKQFIIQDGGEVKYVAFLFETDQVGGLAGKENRRDESKGSVIEAIRTGRIKTYIRVEMLMDNAFIIIPEPETVAGMEEFNLFLGVDYILCTVTPDGMITTVTERGTEADDDPEVKIKFDEIKRLIQTGGDVRGLWPDGARFRTEIKEDSPFDDVLAQSGMSARGVNTLSVAQSAPVVDDPDNDAEPLPDDMEPDADDEFDDVPAASMGAPAGAPPAPAYQESTPMPPAPQTPPEAAYQPPVQQAQPAYPPEGYPQYQQPPEAQYPQQPPQGYAPQPAYPQAQPGMAPMSPMGPQPMGPQAPDLNFGGQPVAEYPDITQEHVEEFVSRKFFSDDLALEVSTEPFDLQFLQGNSYEPFNTDRGPGWLNEYLSHMARDANTRMERLHSENLYRMRERYLRLIQSHCTSIAKSLDVSDDSTYYGRVRFAIEQNRSENLANLDKQVATRREQIEREWNERLDRAGRAAYERAVADTESKYGQSHRDELQKLESIEKDEIERDYNNSMARLNMDRRREAEKLLDMAISATLQELSGVYLMVMRDEKREYIRIQNEMTRFIDDNRKDEKARIDALAEQNRQSNRAEEVRNEFAAKIKAMAAEFDMKKTMLQADIDGINREHDADIRRMESEWQGRLNAERAKSEDLQRMVDDLTEKLTDFDHSKDEAVRKKMESLDAEKEDWGRQMDHIIEVNKRANMISSFLLVAIAIAAIGIGFILGSILNVRKTSQAEQDSLRAYYDQAGARDEDDIPALDALNTIVPGIYFDFDAEG